MKEWTDDVGVCLLFFLYKFFVKNFFGGKQSEM